MPQRTPSQWRSQEVVSFTALPGAFKLPFFYSWLEEKFYYLFLDWKEQSRGSSGQSPFLKIKHPLRTGPVFCLTPVYYS